MNLSIKDSEIFFKLIVKEDFMTDLINVTPEKLKSTAVSFQQTGQNVKRTTSDMLQLVRESVVLFGVVRRVAHLLTSLVD